MAVAYRSGAAGSTSGTSLASVNAPAGVVAGDLLVAVAFSDSGAFTTPTGWTAAGAGAVYDFMAVFYKTATGAEPATYTFTSAGSGASVVAHVLVFTGAATTSPVSVAFGGSTAATASQVAPSVTPGASGAVLVSAFAMAGGARSYTAPSGMTELFDNNDTWATLETSYLALGSTAATGAKTATASASNGYASVSVLIAPAAAGGTGATVTGATAAGTGSAPPGAATGGSSASTSASVTGTTATGTASSPAGTLNVTSPPPSYGTQIIVTPEPGNSPPRVRIDLATTETGRTTVPLVRAPVQTFTINGISGLRETGPQSTLRLPDGATSVALSTGADGIARAVVYDYAAPFGQLVHYMDTDRGLSGMSQPGLLDVDDIWFMHLSEPDLSVRVPVVVDDGRITGTTQDVNQGITKVQGRARPIVVTDGARQSPAGTMTIRTKTDTERVAVAAVLADASTLFVQIPAGRGWGIGSDYYAFGSLKERRVVRYGPVPMREFDLPFVVTDQPAGGILSQRTCADLLAENATCAAVKARYPSCQAVLTG